MDFKNSLESFLNPDMPNVAMKQFGFTTYLLVDAKTTIMPYSGIDQSVQLQEYEKHEQVQSDYTRKFDDSIWEEQDTGCVWKRRLYMLSSDDALVMIYPEMIRQC